MSDVGRVGLRLTPDFRHSGQAPAGRADPEPSRSTLNAALFDVQLHARCCWVPDRCCAPSGMTKMGEELNVPFPLVAEVRRLCDAGIVGRLTNEEREIRSSRGIPLTR